MRNKIKIRSFSQADIKKIAKLQFDSLKSDDFTQFDHTFMNLFVNEFEKRWHTQINQQINLRVMAKGEKIIGFATYTDTAVIKNIYIIPSLRKKGLGRLLCHSIIRKLKQKKLINISTWVLKENINARNFYESIGFKQTLQTRIDDIGLGVRLKEIEYSFKGAQ